MRRRPDRHSLEVEHKHHKITFREDGDLWRCDNLNIEDAKLSSVKAKIDALNRSERRVDVDALQITKSSSWRHERTGYKKVKVTVLCEPFREHGGITECWITDGRGKEKANLSEIAPLDSEADVKAWIALDKIAQTAEKKAQRALDAIQRHDADSLMLAAKEAKAKP